MYLNLRIQRANFWFNYLFAVSCSTVTVTKCQAALKTLQTFPFFNPTCLCREPQLDQKCNSFRTFLFDHPCLFANRRGLYPETIICCTVRRFECYSCFYKYCWVACSLVYINWQSNFLFHFYFS